MVDDTGRVMDYREFRDIPAFDGIRSSNTTAAPHGRHHHLYVSGGGAAEDRRLSKGRHAQEFYLMQRTIEQGLKIGYLPGDYIIGHYHDEGRISSGPGKIRGGTRSTPSKSATLTG